MTENRRITRRELLALSAAAAAFLPTGGALAAARVLRGQVSYRERIALPPHAILEVRLVDVSAVTQPPAHQSLAEPAQEVPRDVGRPPQQLGTDRGVVVADDAQEALNF